MLPQTSLRLRLCLARTAGACCPLAPWLPQPWRRPPAAARRTAVATAMSAAIEESGAAASGQGPPLPSSAEPGAAAGDGEGAHERSDSPAAEPGKRRKRKLALHLAYTGTAFRGAARPGRQPPQLGSWRTPGVRTGLDTPCRSWRWPLRSLTRGAARPRGRLAAAAPRRQHRHRGGRAGGGPVPRGVRAGVQHGRAGEAGLVAQQPHGQGRPLARHGAGGAALSPAVPCLPLSVIFSR